MIDIVFDPNTMLLRVTSERTEPFEQTIEFDEGYPLIELDTGLELIWIAVSNEGNGLYEIQRDEIDEYYQEEGYDVSDLIHMGSIEVKKLKK